MNKVGPGNTWIFKNKIVSGLVIALLVTSSLVILIPISTESAEGYSMPNNVSWSFSDLVTNSSGAVTSSGSDFFVHEDITVPQNSTLNVYPGETAYFDLATGFTVYGSLFATGGSMSPVTFTSNESSPALGDWDGITLENGGGSIDYASFSYAEKGAYLINTSLGISNSQFSENVWGVYVEGSGSEMIGNTFTGNGILPHPDPFYSVGGGVYLGQSFSGFLENNMFSSNIAGIKVNASYVYLMNNGFFNNTVYGIYSMGSDYWNQSFVNIINNDIVNNENFGIYSSSGRELYVSSNNITYNRVGILIESSPGGPSGGGSIYDNYISHNTENGIEVYGNYGTPPMNPGLYISGNEFDFNVIAGIYCEDSQAIIQTNNFIYNWFGIYALNSAPAITDCYFESNHYALWANSSEADITDSEIMNSNPVDLYLENDAYITSLNTTFSHHSVVFADNVSVLEVRWYLHVIVMNGSGPVDSANVTVSDNANGTWSGDHVTNSNGRVHWINVLEYVRGQNSWVFYTPHNITASKNAETGYAEPVMDISRFVIVDLSPGTIPVAPDPPLDLQITLLGTDLELSWGASVDDGTGADDVVSYEIYRSGAVNGPFIWMANVTASDLPTYAWTDPGKGDLDWNNYFYLVRAKDSQGMEDNNENKVGKFVSSLVEGWNMISVPLVQSNTTREHVLWTIELNYATVQGYHAGKSRPWLHWHRNKPNQFNNVIEINEKEGYYIDMITADHLVTAGNVAGQVDINLKSGWNLVGYPCLTNKLRDDALSSIAGKYNMVERFDTSTDNEIGLDPSDYMQPGFGYWIHATEDCVLTLTN